MSTVDYVIKISDGTTTVTLTSSPWTISAFNIQSRDRDESIAPGSIEAWVANGSVVNNLDLASTLNKLLKQAEDAVKNRSLARVFLIFKRNASANEYRSQLLKAHIEWNNDFATQPLWYKNVQKATITFERTNWWEGPETAVPLTNGNGTDTTSGLNVYNCNDGTGSSPNKKHNYAEIKAADVIGDLPAPARLEISNTYVYANNLYDIWIGQNWTDPTNAQVIFEAENATGVTPTVSSDCSNGNFVRKSLASGSETTLLSWTLTDAQMTAFKGQWVHAIVNFPQGAYGTNTYFRLTVDYAVTRFWQSGLVKPNTQRAHAIRDMFQLRMSPMQQGLGSLNSMDVLLRGFQETGGSLDIDVDYLALVPADGWRYLTHNGYGTPTNGRIVDDGIEGFVYTDDGVDERLPIILGQGNQIMLEPGKLQRLYFFMHYSNAFSAKIDGLVSLKIFYRPRRLTV